MPATPPFCDLLARRLAAAVYTLLAISTTGAAIMLYLVVLSVFRLIAIAVRHHLPHALV